MPLRLLLRFVSALLVAGVLSVPQAAAEIRLLECLPNGQCILPAIGGPFGVFGAYFNAIYPWALGTATAIALLWTVWGGLQYMQSGGDQTKRTEAVAHLQHAMMGLALLIFASLVLRFINPTFFR